LGDQVDAKVKPIDELIVRIGAGDSPAETELVKQ